VDSLYLEKGRASRQRKIEKSTTAKGNSLSRVPRRPFSGGIDLLVDITERIMGLPFLGSPSRPPGKLFRGFAD
jgi:hypothetical protein